MPESVTVPGLPESVFVPSPDAVEIDLADNDIDIALDAIYGASDWPSRDLRPGSIADDVRTTVEIEYALDNLAALVAAGDLTQDQANRQIVGLWVRYVRAVIGHQPLADTIERAAGAGNAT